jgi:hypothetical protein
VCASYSPIRIVRTCASAPGSGHPARKNHTAIRRTAPFRLVSGLSKSGGGSVLKTSSAWLVTAAFFISCLGGAASATAAPVTVTQRLSGEWSVPNASSTFERFNTRAGSLRQVDLTMNVYIHALFEDPTPAEFKGFTALCGGGEASLGFSGGYHFPIFYQDFSYCAEGSPKVGELLSLGAGGQLMSSLVAGIQDLTPFIGVGPATLSFDAGFSGGTIVVQPYNKVPSSFSVRQEDVVKGIYGFDVELTYTYDAVPEPKAWAFLIVGFGAVGLVSRRQSVRLRTRRA